MYLSKADWQGFSDYIVDELLYAKKEVNFTLEEVEFGVHNHSPVIRQKWWWDAMENPAHPQYNTFFHKLIDTSVDTKDGKVNRVTFRIKTKNLLEWLAIKRRHLSYKVFKHNLNKNDLAEHSNFVKAELRIKNEAHLSTNAFKTCFRIHDDINSDSWWQAPKNKRLQVVSKSLKEKRIRLTPQIRDHQVNQVQLSVSN